MIVVPNYFIQIGFFDLILIALVEIAFIWFFFPKEMMSKVISMVGAINLIKLGVMVLLAPYVPSIAYSFNQMLLVEVTLMFLLGIIISTLIYENEQWKSSREKAGALAFRITAISSLIWVTYRSLNPSIHSELLNYDPVRTMVPESARFMDFPLKDSVGLAFDSFGLIILLIGLVILYIRFKGHISFQRDPIE
ncbi:MAG: hypothetical protein ACFE95_10760 [Candidatus Hodarchaeota archaeon]